MADDLASFLQDIALFHSVPPGDLARIAGLATVRRFDVGQTIVHQGDPSDALFVIREGMVAVRRLSPCQKEAVQLAYLMPGQTFGEMGILDNQPRSASVYAATATRVVVFRREDFMTLLGTYPALAMGLARILGRYLVEANRKLTLGNRCVRLILIVSMKPQAGATRLGCTIARMLAAHNQVPTVFSEFPDPAGLGPDFGLPPGPRTHRLAAGFDLRTAYEWDPALPPAAKVSIALESLLGEYGNVVMTVPGQITPELSAALELARQVILLGPPERDTWDHLECVRQYLRRLVRPHDTAILAGVNHICPTCDHRFMPELCDFEIPYLPGMAPLADWVRGAPPLPEALQRLTSGLIDRLERAHQVRLLVPTTTDVDHPVDTQPVLARVLEFFGARFGGATCSTARGVWNSQAAGLVSETVHTVTSFTTLAGLNQHLHDVIDLARRLKSELRQEAMAVEVDQKLVLV